MRSPPPLLHNTASFALAFCARRYADCLTVDIWLDMGGTDSQRLFVVNMRRRNSASANLMVTDHKGRIEYVTTALAAMLGYSVKHLRKMEIAKLMPQPFNRLHDHWLKVRPRSRLAS